MIDIHTHTLPEIDDGSSSVSESVEMLRLQYNMGVDTVIATPHFYIEKADPKLFLETRRAAAEKLMTALDGIKERPALAFGAEVQFYPELYSLEELNSFCFSGTRYILVEMPFAKWSEYTYRALERLYTDRGVTPIVAHIERYMGYQSDDVISRLIEANALVQINGNFVISRKTRRKALGMIKDGAVCFIASDCHNLSFRKPNLAEAFGKVTKKLGTAETELLDYWESKVKRHLETI